MKTELKMHKEIKAVSKDLGLNSNENNLINVSLMTRYSNVF